MQNESSSTATLINTKIRPKLNDDSINALNCLNTYYFKMLEREIRHKRGKQIITSFM